MSESSELIVYPFNKGPMVEWNRAPHAKSFYGRIWFVKPDENAAWIVRDNGDLEFIWLKELRAKASMPLPSNWNLGEPPKGDGDQ